MGALLQVILKEFLQLRQDRKIIPALIVGPLAQLIALGYAANLDVTHVPLLLVDSDRSVASRQLIDRFDASGYFEIRGDVPTADAAESSLVDGRAQVVLVIPRATGTTSKRDVRPRCRCWPTAPTRTRRSSASATRRGSSRRWAGRCSVAS
jgi:hypothetical protein